MSATGGAQLASTLGQLLAGDLGDEVTVEELTRQPGGASKETWTFSARSADGERRRLVLRADRTPGVHGVTMALEASLLRAAAAVGVPVPEVVASGVDPLVGPGGYLISAFVDGETIPRRILREDHLAPARAVMTAQCGRILAAIHRIPSDAVPGLPSSDDPVAQLRRQLDQLGQPHPAFELGLLWLEQNRPAAAGLSVVHGDFRNGNLIVGDEGVRAVLDWELAHRGDPVEDLGWLCVRAWRFGSPRIVGGFGDVDDLLGAYQEAGGGAVAKSALWWWIAYGTLRWGIICIAQVLTHLSGLVRSVELAAIGRRVCEVESDLLELLPWGDAAAPPPATAPTAEGSRTGAPTGPHDAPTAVELLEAVGHYLETDVIPGTEGRLRFHGRVAANVVAMVAREIASGAAMASSHHDRLVALGMDSEAGLAAAIRSGAFDHRLDEVTDSVRATVSDKLAVANPAYREPRAAEPTSG